MKIRNLIRVEVISCRCLKNHCWKVREYMGEKMGQMSDRSRIAFTLCTNLPETDNNVTCSVQYLCHNTFNLVSAPVVVEIQNGRFLRQVGGRSIFGSFFQGMLLDNDQSSG